MRSEVTSHRFYKLQIGSELFGERSRNTDDDHVEFRNLRVIGRGLNESFGNERLQFFVFDVRNVILAIVDGFYTPLAAIDAEDFESNLGLFHSEGKADIAEAHDANSSGFVI